MQLGLLLLLTSFVPLAAQTRGVPEEVEQALAQGDPQRALSALETHAATLDAADPQQRPLLLEALATLARIAQGAGDAARQAQALERLVSLTSDAAPVQAGWLNALGYLRLRQGEESAALDAFTQTLALAQVTPDLDPVVVMPAHLGALQVQVNRFDRPAAEAELAAASRLLQSERGHPSARAWLGSLLQLQGELVFRSARTQQALGYYEKAYAVRSKVHGADSLESAQSLLALASAHKGLHDFNTAEERYREVLAIYEDRLGFEHPYVATVLNNMGQMFYLQGRFDEAERVLVKALEIKRARFGDDHLVLAESYNHLGYLYFLLARDAQATAAFEKALHIWRQPQSARPRYAASAQTWLGVIAARQGRLDEAIASIEEALDTLRAIFGEETVATADALRELAGMLARADRQAEAERTFVDAVAAAGRLGSGDWIGEIQARTGFAFYLLAHGRVDAALAMARRAMAGLALRLERQVGLRTGALESELRTLREAAIAHVDALHVSLGKPAAQAASRELLEESFHTAQLARSSSAARALQHFVERFSAGEGEVASLLRQRQDITAKWKELDDALGAALQKPATERDPAVEKRLRREAAGLREQLGEVDLRLEALDIDMARLIRPAPITLDEVQKVLTGEETLIVYLVGTTHSYQWVITNSTANLLRLEVGERELERKVRRLRRKLAPRFARADAPPAPFPLVQAWELYRQVLEPAAEAIPPGSHLLVVADGPLQSLPLSVLLNGPPREGGVSYPDQPWLLAAHPISTLPAAKSLVLLRDAATRGTVEEVDFVGFGDPRLADASVAASEGSTGPTGLRALLGSLRSTVATDALRRLPELPDTADELERISVQLGSARSVVYLRDRATEEQVRASSLEDFRVVQFATHGLMAGDFQGLFEPALVLTPGGSASDAMNDGLLTASEVTELRLDADLVVLSACNTAAPDGAPGAEGLSGLAQAFFHAGGRSLMVTHWEVASDAAVRVTTGLFRAHASSGAKNLAYAHREALLGLMRDDGEIGYAHPTYWAPFALVGDTSLKGSGS